jgi:hypothetical protein
MAGANTTTSVNRAIWIPGNGQVLCDLGETTRIILVDARTAFRFADAWMQAARQAERWGQGLVGMTKHEVESWEEKFAAGRPRLFGIAP